MTFREIALRVLKARGFRLPALRDGWNDGGSDMAVYAWAPAPALEFAIQISVERKWREKAREDAIKAKTRLQAKNFLLISSQRIAEVEFRSLADELLSKHRIQAQRIDAQEIASMAVTQNFTRDILSLFGLTPSVVAAPADYNLREHAAYSYALFSTECSQFRQEVVECTLIAAASSKAPAAVSRTDLVDSVVGTLQLAANQRAQVEGVVDRLLQEHKLFGPPSALRASDLVVEQVRTSDALMRADWQKLGELIARAIKGTYGVTAEQSGRVAKLLADACGVLIMTGAKFTSNATQYGEDRRTLEAHVRQRLQALHASLSAAGILEERQRNALIEEAAKIAGASSIGRHLIAGELFLSLASVTTPNVIKALGGEKDIKIVLDASVAIPILCARLYMPVDSLYSLGAAQLFEEARLHQLSLLLPRVYLEECAAHLLAAYRDYASIIAVPELVGSKNAFVAHYTTLRQMGQNLDFETYLRGFGVRDFDSTGGRGPLHELEGQLARLFRQYKIDILRLPKPEASLRREAEIAIAQGLHDKGLIREGVLLAHDAHVAAFLNANVIEGSSQYVLCTWDRLHFYLRKKNGLTADVMSPAVLGDLLAIALPANEMRDLIGPAAFAVSISREQAERAAKIWDVLAQFEKGALADGELFQLAQAFKDQYLSTTGSLNEASIKNAWTRWREDPKIAAADSSSS